MSEVHRAQFYQLLLKFIFIHLLLKFIQCGQANVTFECLKSTGLSFDRKLTEQAPVSQSVTAAVATVSVAYCPRYMPNVYQETDRLRQM